MKTLQTDFTTPEQSKRLLEIGVPADSADCGIVDDIMHGGMEILQVPYSEWCKGYENISIPCWSAGRLMEIYCIARDVDFIEFDIFADGTNILSQIIKRIEDKIKELDFSKLEE